MNHFSCNLSLTVCFEVYESTIEFQAASRLRGLSFHLTMLKPQHIFGAVLFFLFIYLFGYHSFCKYLRKDTIIIETVEKMSEIPAPAITVVPQWKNSADPFNETACWLVEDVYGCLEETYTYPLNELIFHSSTFNSTARFEPLGALLFTLSSASRKLSSNVSDALMVLVKQETFPTMSSGGIDYPDPDYLPSFVLHDSRYFIYSANPRLIWLKHDFCSLSIS